MKYGKLFNVLPLARHDRQLSPENAPELVRRLQFASVISRRSVLQSLALAIAILLPGVFGAMAAETVAPATPDIASATIAVTGDVYKPDAKDVSDAILAYPSVSAVLIAGDTANAKATPLSSYQEAYKGTYDRFLSKIYPCPGNHDALFVASV